MDNPRPIPSLQHSDSAQWNRELMLSFQAELAQNPHADLLSMFHKQYVRQHRAVQYRELSYAGKINLRTLHGLCDKVEKQPEVNILTELPTNYEKRIAKFTAPKIVPKIEQVPPEEADFRTRLDKVSTASVIFPLSETVENLLAQHSKGSQSSPVRSEEHVLVVALKNLLWASSELWQSPVRGIVVKCTSEIVAKVIIGKGKYTEYTSMQYLAERAPEIPAPRPHGYVEFGSFRIMFMSFLPDITLAKAWPNLSHEGKISIQEQLDVIFGRLRALRMEPGRPLGAVCGEGVKVFRVHEFDTFRNVFTNQDFENLQFSARHYGSDTYVTFLRQLLEHDDSHLLQHESVFTHGDLRPANIMVTRDAMRKGHYIITGIIDWEYSGFYPDWHECSCLTRTLAMRGEDDWYNYLPECISPGKFPVKWLVDRLWSIHFWMS